MGAFMQQQEREGPVLGVPLHRGGGGGGAGIRDNSDKVVGLTGMGFSLISGCIKLSQGTIVNRPEGNKNPSESPMKTGNGQHKFCSRGHWKPSEDARLRELVAIYGPQNWNLIAEKLQGRSGKSCRLRWYNQLDPRINRTAFSEDEERRLMDAHRVYGNKWALISRLFPGRTDNAVKNHWHVLMARRFREKSKPNYQKRKWSGGDHVGRKSVTRELENNTTTSCSAVTRLHNDHCRMPASGINIYGCCTRGQSWPTIELPSAPPAGDRGRRYGDENADIRPPFIDFLGVGAI